MRRIKSVKLTAHKVTVYHHKPCVNTTNLISLTSSEPVNASFNVNSIVNTLSSIFTSKYLNIIVRPCRKQARDLSRDINFYNLQVIDSLHEG